MGQSLGLSRRARIALVVLGVIVVLLVVAQVVAPKIAEGVVRDRLGDDGAQVSVSAFPAVKLALGDIDDLKINSATVRKSDGGFTNLLDQAKGVGEARIRIANMTVGPVRMHDVDTRLDHGKVTATARFELSELNSLVPGGGQLAPAESDGSDVPRFIARVPVLGSVQEVPVVVSAVDGHVEAAPDGLLGGAIRITVFSNPGLRIDSVTGSTNGGSVLLTVRGEIV